MNLRRVILGIDVNSIGEETMLAEHNPRTNSGNINPSSEMLDVQVLYLVYLENLGSLILHSHRKHEKT
jgi:hypothetical protein